MKGESSRRCDASVSPGFSNAFKSQILDVGFAPFRTLLSLAFLRASAASCGENARFHGVRCRAPRRQLLWYLVMSCNITYIYIYIILYIILFYHIIACNINMLKYALHCTSRYIADGANLRAVAPASPYYIRYLDSSAKHYIYIYI